MIYKTTINENDDHLNIYTYLIENVKLQVEIMLDNDSLTVKKMSISSMMQIWCRIQISTGQGIQTIAGNSGPEFVLPLTYAWKPSSL